MRTRRPKGRGGGGRRALGPSAHPREAALVREQSRDCAQRALRALAPWQGARQQRRRKQALKAGRAIARRAAVGGPGGAAQAA